VYIWLRRQQIVQDYVQLAEAKRFRNYSAKLG